MQPSIGDVTGLSSIAVSPASTTTYSLTATGDGGSAQAALTIGVLPAIVSFAANPPAIDAGDSTTLSWSVSGADLLTIDNGIGQVVGTGVTLTPPYSTTYRLTASNDAGSVAALATAVVRPLVDVTPPSVILQRGQTQQFLATVRGGIDGGVVWSTEKDPPSQSLPCSFGGVDNAGLFTYRDAGNCSSFAGRTCRAVATSVDDGSSAAYGVVNCQ